MATVQMYIKVQAVSGEIINRLVIDRPSHYVFMSRIMYTNILRPTTQAHVYHSW
jgi:hypothetical protein